MSYIGGTSTQVLYPRKEGATFDLDYYTKTHMPMVAKHWGKYGLKGWWVTKYNDDSPYVVGATMDWENSGCVAEAMKDAGTPEIMADVKNFSSEMPVLVAGDVVAKSS
ncbi:hypothetical protein CC78DRAFT_535320 [Lojkania enalia]|uniref:EthD domain-containing protein n=1 Tax=Lojkania enalia TaxID=147567 RepID=A0A9P4K3E4_9PLEO|nr:hypothetical protein CC78DRAFT_535320 [Didymosphaeria enalia]